MKCYKCKEGLEPIYRMGKLQFHFCRVCKIPHNAEGAALIDFSRLASSFNPLGIARDTIGKGNPGMTAIARTALEVLLIQAMLDSYQEGLKDGVLLACSQDVGVSEPVGGLHESLPGAAGGPRESP